MAHQILIHSLRSQSKLFASQNRDCTPSKRISDQLDVPASQYCRVNQWRNFTGKLIVAQGKVTEVAMDAMWDRTSVMVLREVEGDERVSRPGGEMAS